MSRTTAQLDAVLRLRSRARDGARRELGEAVRAASVLEERRIDIEQAIAQAGEHRRDLLADSTVDPERVLAAGRHDLVLRVQAQNLSTDRSKIEEEIDRRRLRVAEAERGVQAIEKLKQRIAERERLAEARREQLGADEFAAMKHALATREDADDLLPLR